MAKTLSKDRFVEKVPSMKVNIGGKEFTVPCRESSQGSVGYYLNEKIETFETPEGTVRLQVNCNVTVIGSKKWPQNAAA